MTSSPSPEVEVSGERERGKGERVLLFPVSLVTAIAHAAAHLEEGHGAIARSPSRQQQQSLVELDCEGTPLLAAA